jgi:hypothetical protein
LTAEQAENRDRMMAELDRLTGNASWFAFGSGCKGSAGVPALTAAASQRPVYGRPFTTLLTGMKSTVAQCMGILGFHRTQIDLTPFKAPGCTLYTSLDALVLLTASSGKASWTVAVPPDSCLFGFRFYQQAIVFEAGANFHNAILTNAGEGCIERR